jgi:hypothetical protein
MADVANQPDSTKKNVNKTTSSKGIFGSRKHIDKPAEKIFIDFHSGLEKTVMDNAKAEIFSKAKDMELGKSGVSYRVKKVVKHPILGSGYISELQYKGDGFSYIEKILEAFNDPECGEVWIKMNKSQNAIVQNNNGYIETMWTDEELPFDADDHVIEMAGRSQKLQQLYVEGYALYHVSVLLLFVSFITFFGAALFKYVFYNQTQEIISQSHYTPKNYMAIELLRRAGSTDDMRLRAIRYAKVGGWYLVLEKQGEFENTIFSQFIKPDGSLMQLTKVKTIPNENTPAIEENTPDSPLNKESSDD